MFFKKKQITPQINFKDIGLDFHAHWLPGVDDGCKTIEESVEILTKMKNLGYSKFIASPHIMGERYTNTKEDLLLKFGEFISKHEITNLNLDLGLAAEYLLDEKFEEKLVANDFLTIGNNYILVETSMNYDFPFVRDYIYQLLKLGYRPILAHPERYRYITAEKNYIDIYESMLNWGVEFQLNLFSLAGLFGTEAENAATKLIDLGYYSYVCSDIHLPHQIKLFDTVQKSIFLDKLIQSKQLKNNQFL